MMNGVAGTFVRGFGVEEFVGSGSFQTNGAAAPTSAMISRPRFLPFTVTYEATGIYNVILPPELKLVQSAYYVEAHLVGPVATVGDVRIIANELHSANRRLRLQVVDGAGAAVAPAANGAGVSVHFKFVCTNNTGR